MGELRNDKNALILMCSFYYLDENLNALLTFKEKQNFPVKFPNLWNYIYIWQLEFFFNSSVLCSMELKQPKCLREPTICRMMEMTQLTSIIENKMKADWIDMRKGLFLNSIQWINPLLLFENRKSWWTKIFSFWFEFMLPEAQIYLII